MTPERILYIEATEAEITQFAEERGFLREAVADHYGPKADMYLDWLMEDLTPEAISRAARIAIYCDGMIEDFATWYLSKKEEVA